MIVITVHVAHMTAFDSVFTKDSTYSAMALRSYYAYGHFYVTLLSNNDSTYSAKALGLCIY